MTARAPRLPLSLDPLIAEAKQRARRRRFLIAAVALLVVGAAGAAVALRGSTPPARITPAATKTPVPPLSNLAARAMWCGDAYNASGRGGCHSPDGKWSIVVRNHGKGCTLTVTRASSGRANGSPSREAARPTSGSGIGSSFKWATPALADMS